MAPFPHRHSRFHFVVIVRRKNPPKKPGQKARIINHSLWRIKVRQPGHPRKNHNPCCPCVSKPTLAWPTSCTTRPPCPSFWLWENNRQIHQTTEQYPLWSFDRLLPPPSLHQPREICRCIEDGPFHTLPQIGLVFLPRPMDKIIFFDLDETFATPRTSRQPPPPTTN